MDLVTASAELERMESLDQAGGKPYLAELVSSIVSAAHAVHYAALVRDTSSQRQLIEAGLKIVSESFEKRVDIDALIDESEQTIFSIAEKRSSEIIASSRDIVTSVFEDLTARSERTELITGVDTGYTKLNEYTAGFQKSDLVIIAARPSMGKTAFALNLALNAARSVDEVPTLLFSLEMSKEQLVSRLLCIQGRVDLSHMRRGHLGDDDWSRLYDAAEIVSPAPIYIDDTPALSVLELRARCRRMKKEKGLGMVIVDYLQLMRASRRIDSREQEISDISRNLKALAKELDIPVIALSQLNRKVEERSNRKPMLSDLRESGAIEQDADMIMFIYRDEVYNKESPKKGIAEIIIGKQRNGPVGELELHFHGPSTSFGDLSLIPEPSEFMPTGG